MIIISGASAGLIVDTATDMQQQAEETTEISLAGISGGLEVVTLNSDRDVTPDNASDQSTSITSNPAYLELTVRLQPGSHGLDLNQMVLEIMDGEHSSLLFFDPLLNWIYNRTETGTLKEVQEELKMLAGDSTYTALALRDPGEVFNPSGPEDNLTGGVMTFGSLVRIYINLTALNMELGPSTWGELRFLPLEGFSTYEAFRTPEAYTSRYIELS